MEDHVGFDIDDVLSSTYAKRLKFYNKLYGRDIRIDQIVEYTSFSALFGISEEERRMRLEQFLLSSDYKETEPMPGSQAAVERLAKKKRMSAVTSRLPIEVPSTKEWVHRNYNGNIGTIYFANHWVDELPKKSKAEICLEEGIKKMVEDYLPFAIDCAKAGIVVVLFDRPWNQMKELPKGITRACSWEEIADLL